VNVYDEPEIIEAAVASRDAGGPAVSVFTSWDWDKWPGDVAGELRRLDAHRVDRVLVSLGAADMPERIAALAAASTARVTHA
jgi:hypothetical protein